VVDPSTAEIMEPVSAALTGSSFVCRDGGAFGIDMRDKTFVAFSGRTPV
jgi:hypothetical protein